MDALRAHSGENLQDTVGEICLKHYLFFLKCSLRQNLKCQTIPIPDFFWKILNCETTNYILNENRKQVLGTYASCILQMPNSNLPSTKNRFPKTSKEKEINCFVFRFWKSVKRTDFWESATINHPWRGVTSATCAVLEVKLESFLAWVDPQPQLNRCKKCQLPLIKSGALWTGQLTARFPSLLPTMHQNSRKQMFSHDDKWWQLARIGAEGRSRRKRCLDSGSPSGATLSEL